MISMLTKLFISGSARELKVGGGDGGDLPGHATSSKEQQVNSLHLLNNPIVRLAYTDLIYPFRLTFG